MNNTRFNRLPYARTCAYCLILYQDYENKEDFLDDLKECLMNSQGFSETGSRRINGLIHSSLNHTPAVNESANYDNLFDSANINDEVNHGEEFNQRPTGESSIRGNNNRNSENFVDLTVNHGEEFNQRPTGESSMTIRGNNDRNNSENFVDLTSDTDANRNFVENSVSNDNRVAIDIRRLTADQKKSKKQKRKTKKNNSNRIGRSNSNSHQFVEVTADEIVGRIMGRSNDQTNSNMTRVTRSSNRTTSITTRSSNRTTGIATRSSNRNRV